MPRINAIHKANLFADMKNGLLPMPEGAEILSVHGQQGNICLWYLCDPHSPIVTRKFLILPTGEEADFDENTKYIGTCHLSGGYLVLHVFEKT